MANSVLLGFDQRYIDDRFRYVESTRTLLTQSQQANDQEVATTCDDFVPVADISPCHAGIAQISHLHKPYQVTVEQARFAALGKPSVLINADMGPAEVQRFCKLDDAGKNLMRAAVAHS